MPTNPTPPSPVIGLLCCICSYCNSGGGTEEVYFLVSVRDILISFYSVFFLCSESVEDLAGKRVMFFSYGSGLASAMFSFKVSDDISASSSLNTLVTSLKDIPARLASRRQVEPEEFVKTLKTRENTHDKNNYSPTFSEEDLFPGTYYLTNVDEKFRRTYQRKADQSAVGCMVG